VCLKSGPVSKHSDSLSNQQFLTLNVTRYFQFSNTASQVVSNMLRSLIRQLSSSSSYPKSEFRTLWDQHNRVGSQPSLQELKATLDEILQLCEGETYIILDALDECPHGSDGGERAELLDFISGMHSKVHLLVTSRPEPDIRRAFDRDTKYAVDIEKLTKNDVAQYVKTAIMQQDFAFWDEQEKSQIKHKLLSFEERQVCFLL
jgi:hypothetical protein